MDLEFSRLLNKYDKPLPRYTSYPTVPYWDFSEFSEEIWFQRIKNTFKKEGDEISLYIHLPFCEHLCTFCACNKKITVNHNVEEPYINTLLKEWKMYLEVLENKPIIREIHLGGGTPTFFAPQQLERLITGIINDAFIAKDNEFSIEVHPNFTTEKHLEILSELGFNRISLGIQDFDPLVQYIINRPQSFEVTKEVIDWASKHHFNSINVDLIFGLPKQNKKCIEFTVEKVKKLNPDRIAFYSYAHVPWKSKGQRKYDDQHVPKALEKWEMYQLGRDLLIQNNFIPIGMDHFAKSDDKLFAAYKKGNLHRNFMGYTTTTNKLIIGLGASSISDTWDGFAQNSKIIKAYQQSITNNKFPIENGHLLNDEDQAIRLLILDLMCKNEASIPENIYIKSELDNIHKQLSDYQKDGLLSFNEKKIKVSNKGETFIRNISSVFDTQLMRKVNSPQTFSRSI